MNRRKLLQIINAHQWDWEHGNEEWCQKYIADLEAENHHRLVKLLINHEYDKAYELVDKEYPEKGRR